MVEKENIAPSQILALTFSKEAARHMREKVEKLLQGKEIHVKTFHSFCAELINDHADRCKVPETSRYSKKGLPVTTKTCIRFTPVEAYKCPIFHELPGKGVWKSQGVEFVPFLKDLCILLLEP